MKIKTATLCLLVCALLCGVARAEKAVPVTADEKAAAIVLIKQLNAAYASRDIDKIMKLEHECIESSAVEYEKTHPGKADAVRDAFRGATEDVLHSDKFKMKPLHLDGVQFRREGDAVIVSSVLPIISTGFVPQYEGSMNKVRLLISKFWIKRGPDGWYISRMYLHG